MEQALLMARELQAAADAAPDGKVMARELTCKALEAALLTTREIPHHDHALRTPYPRRHLLDTLFAVMPRGFDLHHLFAGAG